MKNILAMRMVVNQNNEDVWLPYRQGIAFCNREQTTYILPTLLNPVFRFSLKSMNLKMN